MASELKYQKIVEMVLADIDRGEASPGDMMASERELMYHHGVTRDTVRRALEELESLDRVHRVPGVGTFIKEPGEAATMKTKIGKATEEKA